MGICTSCKAILPLWAHFCSRCGAPFQSLTPASEQAQSGEPHLIATKHEIATGMPAHPPTMPLLTTEVNTPDHIGQFPPPSNHTKRTTTKWGIILLILILIAAAGGSGMLAYLLTRPQPEISLIASDYHVGTIPAGSNGTSLHIRGKDFTHNSAVTFFLDKHPAPNAPTVVSNNAGMLTATLPITASWPLGLHILTAKDAKNYSTQKGIQIEIVAQGQGHTPGPNGAPPDDASFNMQMSVQVQNAGDTTSTSTMDTLLVNGNSSPDGGSVCRDRDNMQPQTYNSSTTSGLPDTLVYTFSCSGTYKHGHISYTETLLSALVTVNYQGRLYTCRLLTSGVDEQLSGNYTTQGKFVGTVTLSAFPTSDFACTTGQLPYFNFSLLGSSGTWSATYALGSQSALNKPRPQAPTLAHHAARPGSRDKLADRLQQFGQPCGLLGA